MHLPSLISASLAAIFMENFIFTHIVQQPFLYQDVKKNTITSYIGILTCFVMCISSMLDWIIYTYILIPRHFPYLQILAFLMIAFSLITLLLYILKRLDTSLSKQIYKRVPFVLINCMILKLTLSFTTSDLNLLQSSFYAMVCSLAYLTSLLLFSSVMEHIIYIQRPKAAHGAPLALIAAGLIALVFSGFSSM